MSTGIPLYGQGASAYGRGVFGPSFFGEAERTSVPGITAQQRQAAPEIEPDIPSEWMGSMPLNSYAPSYYSTPTSLTGGAGGDLRTGAGAAAGGIAGDFWGNLFGDLGGQLGNAPQVGNNNQANTSSNPSVWYQPNQYIPPTLQDRGMGMAQPMNNWLMNGYMNALPNAVQATNDAWGQQMNINARNSLIQSIFGGMMGAMNGGNSGGGFRDTASRQQAGGGQYTTSIDAGGMNPNQSAAAVNAMQNSHPGTNSQHGDLRRGMASASANNINRLVDRNYARLEDGRDSGLAQEGMGLMANQMNSQNRQGQQRVNMFQGMMPMFQSLLRGS